MFSSLYTHKTEYSNVHSLNQGKNVTREEFLKFESLARQQQRAVASQESAKARLRVPRGSTQAAQELRGRAAGRARPGINSGIILGEIGRAHV